VYAQIVWMVSAEWMAPSGIFNSHLIMATAIQRCGTQAQREAYLPQMATGELRGGLALTEPGAGTDLQAIRTSARRTESGDYVLTGTKTWITNSLHGNLLLVLAKTDKAAVRSHKGLSMFIVKTKDDDGNWVKGITVNKLKKMGYRSIDTCEVVFEGVEVSSADLLAESREMGSSTQQRGWRSDASMWPPAAAASGPERFVVRCATPRSAKRSARRSATTSPFRSSLPKWPLAWRHRGS